MLTEYTAVKSIKCTELTPSEYNKGNLNVARF
jgi:hypothetical protein